MAQRQVQPALNAGPVMVFSMGLEPAAPIPTLSQWEMIFLTMDHGNVWNCSNPSSEPLTLTRWIAQGTFGCLS